MTMTTVSEMAAGADGQEREMALRESALAGKEHNPNHGPNEADLE